MLNQFSYFSDALGQVLANCVHFVDQLLQGIVPRRNWSRHEFSNLAFVQEPPDRVINLCCRYHHFRKAGLELPLQADKALGVIAVTNSPLTAKIEGNVFNILGDQECVVSECMSHSEFIEHIRVSAGKVSNDEVRFRESFDHLGDDV